MHYHWSLPPLRDWNYLPLPVPTTTCSTTPRIHGDTLTIARSAWIRTRVTANYRGTCTVPFTAFTHRLPAATTACCGAFSACYHCLRSCLDSDFLGSGSLRIPAPFGFHLVYRSYCGWFACSAFCHCHVHLPPLPHTPLQFYHLTLHLLEDGIPGWIALRLHCLPSFCRHRRAPHLYAVLHRSATGSAAVATCARTLPGFCGFWMPRTAPATPHCTTTGFYLDTTWRFHGSTCSCHHLQFWVHTCLPPRTHTTVFGSCGFTCTTTATCTTYRFTWICWDY